jgi:hypothetical protein
VPPLRVHAEAERKDPVAVWAEVQREVLVVVMETPGVAGLRPVGVVVPVRPLAVCGGVQLLTKEQQHALPNKVGVALALRSKLCQRARPLRRPECTRQASGYDARQFDDLPRLPREQKSVRSPLCAHRCIEARPSILQTFPSVITPRQTLSRSSHTTFLVRTLYNLI